jgi:transposase
MENASYPCAAVERAMKVQEVILRAVDGRLKWYQAAEILGISARQMRRWKGRYERWGTTGCSIGAASTRRPSACRWRSCARC